MRSSRLSERGSDDISRVFFWALAAIILVILTLALMFCSAVLIAPAKFFHRQKISMADCNKFGRLVKFSLNYCLSVRYPGYS